MFLMLFIYFLYLFIFWTNCAHPASQPLPKNTATWGSRVLILGVLWLRGGVRLVLESGGFILLDEVYGTSIYLKNKEMWLWDRWIHTTSSIPAKNRPTDDQFLEKFEKFENNSKPDILCFRETGHLLA